MELLTGPRIMAGHGSGPIRCCHLAERLGVDLYKRTVFYGWLESEGLFLAPINPFWHLDPLAGCVDIEAIRQRLKKAIAKGERLPFSLLHIPELNHA